MKNYVLTFALLFSLGILFAVTAIHIPPTDFVPGKDIEVALEITTGEEDIALVELIYNVSGSSIRQRQSMRSEDLDNVHWIGYIPRTVISATAIEYYFEITLFSDKIVQYPLVDGVAEPFSIQPLAPQGEHSKGFVLISDEDTINADEGYVLAVSFLALADEIDHKSIKVYVGERDVTSKTKIEDNILLYREDRPIAGQRTALVTARVKGKEVYSDTWTTNINPGKKRAALPLDFRGSLNFAANIYEVSEHDFFGSSLNEYTSWADLYATLGFLDLQTNIFYSTLEDKNEQPINRYTIGMQIPHLDIFLGDYAPTVSQLTLSGKNIRGAYAKLYAQYLKLILSHGQSLRTTRHELDDGTKYGTFKRDVVGARIQFGSDDGFRMAMNLSRHRDDIESLEEEYFRRVTADGDTLYTVTAKDNAVLSFDVRLHVPDQNFMVGAEVAGSLLNSNTIPGPISKEDLSEYGIPDILIDPVDFADLFVVNKNMEPFIPSMANVAWLAYARLFFWNNLFNAEYSETGHAFNSFGSFYNANDTKRMTINDQLNIGRFLLLSGSYSKVEDNLMKFKNETNIFESITASAVLRIPHIPYLKATYFDSKGENRDDSEEQDNYDFLPTAQSNQNITFGGGYNFKFIPYVPTQVDFSYKMGNSLNQRSFSVGDSLQTIGENEIEGYNFSMINRFKRFPLKTHISYSTYTTTNLMSLEDYRNTNIYGKAELNFFKDKLVPYFSYRQTKLDKGYDAQSYNYMNFGLETNPYRSLNIIADMGMKEYVNELDDSLNYKTNTFRLQLTQRF